MTRREFLVIARRRIRDKFIAQGMEGVPEDVIDGLAEFAAMNSDEEGTGYAAFKWDLFHVGTVDNEALNAIIERNETQATVH